MQDLRKLLIGTWSSNKRRTLANFHRYHTLKGAKKRMLGSLFGKLVLRYTPSRVHFALRGTEWTAKYEVVAADSESIVLRLHSDNLWRQAVPGTADIVKQMSAPRFQHINFRRRGGHQYYWIGCGTFCEWFRRQEIQPSRCRQRRVPTRVRNRVSSARRA
jgi:hypothetical protein